MSKHEVEHILSMYVTGVHSSEIPTCGFILSHFLYSNKLKKDNCYIMFSVEIKSYYFSLLSNFQLLFKAVAGRIITKLLRHLPKLITAESPFIMQY